MKVLATVTLMRFADQKRALTWAEQYLDRNEYEKIYASYRMLLKRTFQFIVGCCMPIMLLFLSLIFLAPFSKIAEAKAMPAGATSYVIAKADYDGNFFWTHDSKVYEHSLEEYGLNAADYEFMDRVKVYVNEEQEVIKAEAVKKGLDIRDIEVFGGIIGAFVLPALIIIVWYVPFAYRNYGKEWAAFYKEYGNL